MLTLGQAKAALAKISQLRKDTDTTMRFDYLGIFRRFSTSGSSEVEERGHGFRDRINGLIILVHGQPGGAVVTGLGRRHTWEHLTMLQRLAEIPEQLPPPTEEEIASWLNFKVLHTQRLSGTATSRNSDQVRVVYQRIDERNRSQHVVAVYSYQRTGSDKLVRTHSIRPCSPLELLSFQARAK